MNFDGKANIAANKTITASTPLHPGAILTACEALVLLDMMSPFDNTSASNICIMPALMEAKNPVNGSMTACRIGSYNSKIKSDKTKTKNIMVNLSIEDSHVKINKHCI